MGKNGYWLMLDDKYKSFDEYLEKIKADERAKIVDQVIEILKTNALISAMSKIEQLNSHK